MDEAEFSAYFRRVFPRVVAYLRHRVGQRTAEEIAARTLQAVWEKNVDITDDTSLARVDALTFSIATGLLSNERRAQRRRERLTAKLGSQPSSDVIEGIDGEYLPAWFIELPHLDQLTLWMVAEGFTRAEIGGALGCSEAAAAQRVSRLRARLRNRVSERGGDHDGIVG